MATTRGTGRTRVRSGTQPASARSQSVGKSTSVAARDGATRGRAGRKIQKRMPVILEDGSVRRPPARGSKAVQPPAAHGPVTSRLPLSRGTDGLANIAVGAVQEFWEKFHQYHALQAELEKLYLWFENFEQSLKRDNEELDRILAGAQALHRPPAEIVGKPTARPAARARAGQPEGASVARGQMQRRTAMAKAR